MDTALQERDRINSTGISLFMHMNLNYFSFGFSFFEFDLYAWVSIAERFSVSFIAKSGWAGPN
jgi:hypothetical protein